MYIDSKCLDSTRLPLALRGVERQELAETDGATGVEVLPVTHSKLAVTHNRTLITMPKIRIVLVILSISKINSMNSDSHNNNSDNDNHANSNGNNNNNTSNMGAGKKNSWFD